MQSVNTICIRKVMPYQPNGLTDWTIEPDGEEVANLVNRTKEIVTLLIVTETRALMEIQDQQELQKATHNKRGNLLDKDLVPGTVLYLKVEDILKKMQSKYAGPYTIIEKSGLGNYRLHDATRVEVIPSTPVLKLKITNMMDEHDNMEIEAVSAKTNKINDTKTVNWMLKIICLLFLFSFILTEKFWIT